MATYETVESGRASTFLSTMWAILRLIRVEYCLLGAAAVLAGAFVISGTLSNTRVLLSASAVFFVAVGCYAFDDYFDRACDTANEREDRPLVMGTPTPHIAAGIGTGAFVLSVILAVAAGMSTTIAIALGALLAMVYNRWLQNVFPLKNILLAGAFPTPLIIGALAVGSPEPILLYCAGLAYVVGLGFEVMIDIPDAAGDTAEGVATVATRYGSDTAAKVSAAIYMLAAIMAVAPFFLAIDPRFQWNMLFLLTAGTAALAHATIGRYVRANHSRTRAFRLKAASFVSLNTLILAYVVAVFLQST
ncbi:MAG: UbiA family prenyltransferase [Dehalococcoidia bacterium]|nr:UbiA family prenyltransferase [Dehalococcoidia bacterium]